MNACIKFLLLATKMHGDKYDYSLVKYTYARTKVQIICKDHGVFQQRPDSHVRGAGCPICSGNSKEVGYINFITKCTALYKGKYDYSQVDYTNNSTKVKIVCSEHGIFEKAPRDHSKGSECPKCARLHHEEFISKALIIHDNKYEYTSVDYTNSHTKVVIICSTHGMFYQTPESHLRGYGCPLCAVNGFKQDIPGILYYLRVTSGCTILYKIGITNRTVQDRFRLRDLEKITILKTWEFPLGVDAYNKEQETLKQFREFKYIGEPVLSSGNTELFTIDVLQLDNKD